jgi:hypothetical protein
MAGYPRGGDWKVTIDLARRLRAEVNAGLRVNAARSLLPPSRRDAF